MATNNDSEYVRDLERGLQAAEREIAELESIIRYKDELINQLLIESEPIVSHMGNLP